MPPGLASYELSGMNTARRPNADSAQPRLWLRGYRSRYLPQQHPFAANGPKCNSTHLLTSPGLAHGSGSASTD
jgi:hypothetical protein